MAEQRGVRVGGGVRRGRGLRGRVMAAAKVAAKLEVKAAARVAVTAVAKVADVMVVVVGDGMVGMEIGGLVRCRPRFVRRARWTTGCGALRRWRRAALLL